jgi:glycosyltransferase involved in cell wall biosynthesis
MNIAYFADTFPAISETFVINEIDEMSRYQGNISVIAVNTPEAAAPHKLGKIWAARTVYLDNVNRFPIKNVVAMLMLAIMNPRRFVSAAAKVQSLDKAARWKFRQTFWLANRMKKERIQHMHAHFACEAAESAWMVHLLTGIPFSISTHGYDIYVAPYRFIRQMSADATFVRSVCGYNIAALRALGVREEKITLVHCGIRTEQFSPGESKAVEDIDILFTGRLHPVKGVSVLIDAVSRLIPEFPSLRVGIVGDGPERESLEALVSAANLTKNVQFHGACSQDEIRDLLARSKTFCLPSLGDSVPVATMEAMAMGLPSVSTTVKGIPEQIEHEKSGLLVPPGDPGALAEALRRLLRDPQYRHELGMAGLKRVTDEFNQTKEVEKLWHKIRESVATSHAKT